MEIERIARIDPELFARDYLRANRPVVITDALDGWRLSERWTPAYLTQAFGHEKVQLYNSYFDFKALVSLEGYFAKYFGLDGPLDQRELPYVRWYTKLRDVRFAWADAVFERLREHWSPLYFLPTSDYVLPYAPSPEPADPTVAHFPAKGLFISGRGSRTGLHVDPWHSDAVLCQLFGDKRWVMYAPDQAQFLTRGDDVVDPDRPDHEKFPEFSHARAAYEFDLRPGETVFVPRGWYHIVKTTTDAISMTWNFVHRSTSAPFRAWLREPISPMDQSVLRFFFAAPLGEGARPEAIEALLARASA